MSDEVEKRSTYIGQVDLTQNGKPTSHLRFVISDFIYDEVVDEECALVVNMTSKHNSALDDLTCELNSDDHPEIDHASYIEYSRAERVSKKYILENIANKKFFLKEQISEELLRRIQAGVSERLEDMPQFVEDYLDAF